MVLIVPVPPIPEDPDPEEADAAGETLSVAVDVVAAEVDDDGHRVIRRGAGRGEVAVVAAAIDQKERRVLPEVVDVVALAGDDDAVGMLRRDEG